MVAKVPPVIVDCVFAIAHDSLSLLWSVFIAGRPTVGAKSLLCSLRKGRLFVLPEKVRRDIRDFKYQPALGLDFEDPSLSLLLGSIDKVDCVVH